MDLTAKSIDDPVSVEWPSSHEGRVGLIVDISNGTSFPVTVRFINGETATFLPSMLSVISRHAYRLHATFC